MGELTVTFSPHNKKVEVERGTTLLEASSGAEITLNNLCGGEGVCGRCKMVVTEGEVSGEVTGKLTRDQIKEGYVLACVTSVESDLSVTIPEVVC